MCKQAQKQDCRTFQEQEEHAKLQDCISFKPGEGDQPGRYMEKQQIMPDYENMMKDNFDMANEANIRFLAN